MSSSLDGFTYNDYKERQEYLDIILPTLFYNSVFQPGITYNDSFQIGNAGQFFVFRLTPGNIKVSLPATDLDNEDVKNEIVPITINNTYHSSKKIYGVQAAAVNYNAVAMHMELSARELAEAWNRSGIACLINEGKGRTMKKYTPTDQFSVKSVILDAKTEMYKNKTNPSVVLCSPDFYQVILEAAGNTYTPSLNERMVYSGEVGYWLGLTFINCNMLQADLENVDYYDFASMEQKMTEKLKGLQFIMYDPSALSILVNFNEARIIPSEKFFGSLIQVEMNAGFRVTQTLSVSVNTYTDTDTAKQQKL
jgi:hypothetical protein